MACCSSARTAWTPDRPPSEPDKVGAPLFFAAIEINEVDPIVLSSTNGDRHHAGDLD
jgi:hypothetical protein